MLKENVTSFVSNIGEKFSDIIEEYTKKCLKLERLDDKYKDSDNNIFNLKQHPLLMDLIKMDRDIRGKEYNNYSEALVDIEVLDKKLVEHLSALSHRSAQAEHAAKIYDSEVYFLNDFRNKLWVNLNLIRECLIPLADFENKIKTQRINFRDDDDYVLFLINKCTILSRTANFQNDYLKTLSEVNNEVQTRTSFNSKLFFRLGSMNFSKHNYPEAEMMLRFAITKLETEHLGSDGNWPCDKVEMLFSSYMMLTMCFEFCGDYTTALSTLLDSQEKNDEKICDEFIQHFDKVLIENGKQNGIEFLAFNSTNSAKKQEIIEILSSIFLKDNIFPGKIANFVFTNGNVYKKIIKSYNLKLENLLDTAIPTSDPRKETVRSKLIQKEEENQPMHDFLHLLAHCLNEQGVTIFKNNKNEGSEDIARKTILLARALMLFVSEGSTYFEDCFSYKSCFATIFAEAGDFDIANQELMDILNNYEIYKNLDVAAKAEIDFFYYLIHRMSRISNEAVTHIDDSGDEYYNHYLNCCYRNFDYDAIAHMSLFSLEYFISTILLGVTFSDIATKINLHDEHDISIQNRLNNFMEDIKSEYHNEWLDNQCEKIKYMYRFLSLFFKKEDNEFTRNFLIYDIACKYLHHCNINTSYASNQVEFVEFEHPDKAKECIKELFKIKDTVDQDDYIELSTGSCTYVHIKAETGIPKMTSSVEKTNNMFFVVYDENDKDLVTGIHKAEEELNWKKSRLRYFPTETSALKEYFLFCTYMTIRSDFINPNSIFVLTPINSAKPCKYQITDFNEFLLDVYEQKGKNLQPGGQIEDQYALAVANHNVLSINWLNRMEKCSNALVWAISFIDDMDDNNVNLKYFYYFPKQCQKSAMMFNQIHCLFKLKRLYVQHARCHSLCHADRLCKICLVDNISGLQNLFASFTEIDWAATLKNHPKGKLIIWKNCIESYACWRLVFVDITNKPYSTDDIGQIICKHGCDEIFEFKSNDPVIEWPKVFKYKEDSRNFLFICHYGQDDDLVKSELTSFFEHYGIRYWYDNEKFVERDTWKEQVREVINSPNCVGCVVLITNELFFKSNQITDEIQIISEKKKAIPGFAVIPVVYNCINYEGLSKLIQSSYGFGENARLDDQLLCKNLILASKDKVKLYLNVWKGKTLLEYTENEINHYGRPEGTMPHACKEMDVML